MRGLLADANCDLHVDALVGVLTGPSWLTVWEGLGLVALHFPALGLAADAPDSEVWSRSQSEGLVLITGNRNGEGPDSLDRTIRTLGTASNLPVVTVGNLDRVLRDKAYRDRAAEHLAEVLFEIDRYRGAGRLYIPRR